jgi:hypothetical protein
LHDIFEDYGGELSQLCLTSLVNREGVEVSKQTIQRILDGPDWKALTMKGIPTNSEKHRLERVKFAQENLDNTFGGDGSDTLWVDVDEKNFKDFDGNRVLYCPSELAHIYDTFNTQTRISKDMVMFFGAVARPRPKKNFNGKILLLPIVKEKIQKRRSEYANKGETVSEPTTLDKKGFIKICTNDLLIEIRKITKKNKEIKKVIVQMDRAGGHGGGRSDMKGILKELNDVGAKERPPVEFTTQSAKSPDFNSLDLGAWNSISCGVPAIKAQKEVDPKKKVCTRIIEEVKKRWENWDSMTRLENIFATKSRIMQAVIDAEGDIKYKIPRSGKSHKDEGPSYVPEKVVKALVVE